MVDTLPATQDQIYTAATDAAVGGIMTGFFLALVFVYLAVATIYVIAEWRLFSKAGIPGWAIFVPIYNTYCLFRLLFGKGWLFLLLLVPLVNILLVLILPFRLGAVYSDNAGGFALGLGFLFLPYLFVLLVGLGPFHYHGPN